MAETRTGTASPWHDEFQRYKTSMEPWAKACTAINKLYLRENIVSKFAILWSNVQTLQPAVYARVPQAVVSRRFKDSDPTARTAVEVIERGINYTLDAYDFDQVMRQCRDDYLLYARATAWARYEPTMREVSAPLEDVQTGEDPYQTDAVDEEGEPHEDRPEAAEPYEEIDFERVCVDYVHRDDFGHTPARTWGEVWAVWRKAYLTRDELMKRFPQKLENGSVLGKVIPLDHTPKGVAADSDKETRERTCKATIYEVWSKRDRQVIFVAHDYPDELERVDPFLTLNSFWPCPKPAFGTTTNDSLSPVPDYKFYQDQAEEIDKLTTKIEVLEKSLKVAGFYPAGPSGDGKDAIRTAMGSHELEVTLVPVSGWSSFMEGGGANQIQWVPLNHVIEALKTCVELRDQLISDIYQITGISDIVRGDTNPNETATAQGIKAQWGSIRIRDRQMELARFAKDLTTIIGEIIADKFQPETLEQMTGIPLAPQPVPPLPPMQPGMPQEALQQVQQQMQQAEEAEQQKAAVIALMRDDAQRGFRIEIETDSTIEPDEQAEKTAAIELVGMMGQFFQQSVPIIQSFPPAADLIGQTLLLALRRFRVGRELEGAVETLADQLKQLPPPQPAPTGPDPAIAQHEAEQQAQIAGQKARMEMQATQAKTAATVQAAEASMAKTQMDAQAHQIRNQSDMERMQVEAATRNMAGGMQ